MRKSVQQAGLEHYTKKCGVYLMKAKYDIRDTTYKNGFTIVELLLALAITALLLTAAAVAFDASLTNYQENENIFKAINNARQALCRITNQLRSGIVDPNAAYLSENLCKFDCADGSEIMYRYDNNDNKLYLRDLNTATDYVLCENVTSMSFDKNFTDDELDVKSVQISMTVQSGNIQRTFPAAVVIRRIPR